nr:reverse transcriptase domain-containing protein [Tanacetum cinerariifolium]
MAKDVLPITSNHCHHRSATQADAVKTKKLQEDFIVERPKDDSPAVPMEVEEELPDPLTLFIDESSCIDGFGSGLILTSPKGT